MRQNPVVFFLSELERKLSIVSSSKSFRAIESLLMVIVFERSTHYSSKRASPRPVERLTS